MGGFSPDYYLSGIVFLDTLRATRRSKKQPKLFRVSYLQDIQQIIDHMPMSAAGKY